jgi:nucleotide-binding universal stress UspA family protein
MTGTPIRKIICPIDFSDHSERALRFALGLAEQCGAMIDVLHVYQVPFYAPPHQPMEAEQAMSERYRDLGREWLDRVLERPQHRRAAVPVGSSLVEGKPHEEICRFAEEHDVDLIVMGTHGRTGLARVLMGSVVERVVRTSSVPVLTVPLPE